MAFVLNLHMRYAGKFGYYFAFLIANENIALQDSGATLKGGGTTKVIDGAANKRSSTPMVASVVTLFNLACRPYSRV